MRFVILANGKIVARARTEAGARLKAEQVQANPAAYIDDGLCGTSAVVGFAPKGDLSAVSYLKPRDSAPDEHLPPVLRQFR